MLTLILFIQNLTFAQVVPQGFLVNPAIQTVTIGSQVWMKYNLDLEVCQDGTKIHNHTTDIKEYEGVKYVAYNKEYTDEALDNEEELAPPLPPT